MLNKFKNIFKKTDIINYEDKELKELQVKIKILEKELESLIETKNEYLINIEDFNKRYTIKLGDLIEKILQIKQNILYKKAKQKAKEFEKIKNEFTKLKTEYKSLQQERGNLEDKLEKINEFDDEYDEVYEELKKTKSKIDDIEEKLEQKRQEAKEAKEKFEQDEDYKNYEEVKQDYQDFHQEYKETIEKERNIKIISKEELQRLKKLFRKSVKLCHPDLVKDEFKQQAHEVMIQLNAAYVRKDIDTIEKIYTDLENELFFVEEESDIKYLKAKKQKLLESIEREKLEIKEIMQDETFQLLETIEDLDEFFEELKLELEKELKELERIYDNLNNEEINKDNEILNQINYIYHMTHINNLETILKYGLLSHNNNVVNSRIDNPDVNDRRDFNEPIYHKNLHSYVPFYFNPRNPMLFVNRDKEEEIVILAFDKRLIYSKGAIFTNGNASVRGTKFYNDLNDLDKLNWECIKSKYWNDFKDGKREIMSEVLIPDKVDIDKLQKIYCYNRDTKLKIEKLLFNYPNIAVEINQELFF